MAIPVCRYYDSNVIHSTLAQLAQAANGASPTGATGAAGPAGAGPAGATGPAGPTGPGSTLFIAPSADPHILGAVWSSNGRLLISAG